MKISLSSAAVLAVACSFALAPVAVSQTPQAGQTAEAAKPADGADKVVCKRIEVKSKMPSAVVRKERICHTQAEWDQALKVNEEMMKKYKDAFAQGSPPN